MLSSLHIENVALIKENTLLFGEGFTVLTGETGAGKSIILDALSLLCGARSDRELIRNGESYAFVEGCFDGLDSDTLAALKELDAEPDEDGALFLSRRITADGKSTAKIGCRPVPSSRLRAVAEKLINIHGQQDTLLLADKNKHLPLIDRYAGITDLVAEYRELYGTHSTLCGMLEAERSTAEDAAFKREMLEYKLAGLKKAKLKPGEEEELLAARTRLRSAEKIATAADKAYGSLYGKEKAASEAVWSAVRALTPLKDVLPEMDGLIARLDSVKCEIDDVADTLKELSGTDAESAAAELDKTETRLEQIAELKRRFATDFNGLLTARDRLLKELEALDGGDDRIKIMEEERDRLYKELEEKSAAISRARKESAVRLEKEVAERLSELDMPSVSFSVRFNTVDLNSSGCDEAELLLAANAGEAPKPLSKIASGGELARIMLAFKSALAKADSVSVMVFDEIDTGISGKTAQKTGIALKKLSAGADTQVLCVTHSAQIAALADTHLLVSKREENGRTKSLVAALDDEGRTAEVARIIGGINVGEATLTAARELIDEARRL